MRTASPLSRLALAAGLLIAVLMACGREITGPGSAPVSLFNRVGAFLFSPVYETAVPAALRTAALQQVAFERVRVTLRREDGSIALDTVVLFPVGADQLVLTLQVPLPANAPSSGVPLSLNLGYVNAAGDTVFRGGPLPVTVVPSTAGGNPPVPVQVPVQYTGPGSNASGVAISPKLAGGQPGQRVTFTAQAVNTAGQPIPNTPLVFGSGNTSVVEVDATSGVATFQGRGTAYVYAQLLTGQRDSAFVTVTLPAARLALVSGADQTALAGATLGSPVVAKVQASDGVGVGGVTVTFAAGGGGTTTPATAVSASDGTVSTSWRLGPTAGTQTLTITSTGLAGSPLSVNATARAVTPTKLAIGTQPAHGIAGTTLAPVTAVAQDAEGNVVTPFTGDVTVALGANPGSATLSGTTTVKAVAGVATFSDLKVNRPGTGYTLAFSSAPLAAVTSSAFNIVAGAADQLVFTSVPEFAEAGVLLTRPVIVGVQDAAGNVVSAFTGAVTIALDASVSPAGAALTGTLTRNAVAGVATFNDLKFNRVGRTTLTATATSLRGATSSAISVLPGRPASLEVVSGDGQKAAAGTRLGEISVRLADDLGNGIADATVTFAVTGGGGSLNTASAKTDANGVARVLWTIGAGPQTMTASSSGLTTTITATSTSATMSWTGATSSAWTTASNWSPAFVPTAADVVNIPVTTTAPVISAPASVLNLTLAAGATLTNNSTLQVGGSLDAGTTITGSGSVTLVGASGNLKGVINQAVAVTGAAYTLSGNTQVTGALTISASGKLTVGGKQLFVTGNFSTSGSGRLAMANAADSVTVSGDVTFAGGSEAGFLTAGVLSVLGNFTATGTTFAASGTHQLTLAGSATPQTLAFSSPLTGQGINHLTFENGAAKTMSGALQVMGDVSILESSAPIDGSATVKIAGDFTDATVFPDSGGNPNPLGGWRVATTHFSGTNKVINSTFITSNVTIGGTVRIAPCTSCLGDSRYASLVNQYGYMQVNGDVTVSGTGAVLKLNGNELKVYGNFATASGGSLDMTDANDYLFVQGSATFGGGSTAGKLTLGTLEVIQDFTQSGSADSFAPDASFETYIGDPYYGPVLRASRAQRARAAEAAPSSPAVEAARARRLQRAQASRAERDARRMKLDRQAAAYARHGMAAPMRGQSAGQTRAGNDAAYRLYRPRRAYSGTSVITFANPTSSFFGVLYLSGPDFVLASDVLVKAEFETGYSAFHAVSSSSATPRKITSHGADVRDLGFNNVSWVLLDGSYVWAMDWVEFANMDPAADQFTVARTSDELATCDCAPYYELYQWTFSTTPTTGNYIKASDTNGGPNVLELRMYNPDPSAHGGHVSTAGGALISNWPETSVVTWLGGTSSTWNVASNWSGGVVPTYADDVLIPAGTPYVPTTSAGDGNAHHLTIASGAYIQTTCSYQLYVYGNVVAPLDAAGVQTCEGDAIHLMGDGTPAGNTVVGNFEFVTVKGNYRVAGPGNRVIVGLSWGSLVIDGASAVLTVNGGRVDANQLYVQNGGTLVMTNAADQVFVGNDNAYFNGGSTAGKLTAGTISFTGSTSCLYTGGPTGSAFAPSGSHQVVFAGTNNCAQFADPINSFFQDVTVNGGNTLTVQVGNPTSYPGFGFNVNGTLTRGSGATPMVIAGAGGVVTANVSGLNITGGPTSFNSFGVRFVAGTSNATFNSVTFTGYGGYNQPILTVTRPTGTSYTFNSLNFSAVTGLSTGGLYVANTNAGVTVTMVSPLPAGSLLFSGNVIWP